MLDEITREFLLESAEALGEVESDLVALEANPAAAGVIDRVFRALHTIKGTSSFLGYPRIERVGHAAEGLLSEVRAGATALGDEALCALLETVDALRAMLGSIELTGLDGLEEHEELVGRLVALRCGEGAEASGGVEEAVEAAPGAVVEAAEQAEQAEQAEPERSAAALEGPRVDETLRVDVAQLDRVLNLVSELVLERNHLVQLGEGREDEVLARSIQRLNTITTELQERLTRARMQPLESLWQKLPRLVREVARACGKRVQLELSGAQTELDRTVLTAIKDPLTHIIRNAIDHGIEAPEARLAVGKPETGRLRLKATHSGGLVTIEVSDDGGGIDVKRVTELAVERGVITEERARGLSPRQVLRYIFAPGFSTAHEVTSVSGRGVGMDVVRSNIEAIGGSIDIRSARGQGTAFVLRIPLTLAIVPALVVRQSGARYAIPQAALVELVHVPTAEVRSRMDALRGAVVMRLRGDLLPLVHLGELLGACGADAEPGSWLQRWDPESSRDRGLSVVVIEADATRYGLVVDDITDTREIVVKPLSRHFQDLLVYAGATLMGDGSIALILDAHGLARRAGVRLEVRAPLTAAAEDSAAGVEEPERYVLVEGRDAGRIAIATPDIIRLEELDDTRVERSGHGRLIQRPEGLLAVEDLSALLDERRRSVRAPTRGAPGAGSASPTPSAARPRTLIVCRGAGARVGLIVDHVVDVVVVEDAARHPPSRFGVRFSTVIAGEIAEVLDLDALADAILRGVPALPPGEGDGFDGPDTTAPQRHDEAAVGAAPTSLQ